MQPDISLAKTFQNRQEAIAYLEHTLPASLRDAASNMGNPRIYMASIDATTHEVGEVGGDADVVSSEAIAFLSKDTSHAVAVVITAGAHRFCIKASPCSCRMTMRRKPAKSTMSRAALDHSPPRSALSGPGGPAASRPPGLSGGHLIADVHPH